MNQNQDDKCPLAGTEFVKYCALHEVYQNDNTAHSCQYRDECTQIKESLPINLPPKDM
jgi:hypothetical protein